MTYTIYKNENVNRALKTAGKFGFISQAVFWNHICRLKKSENYRNWQYLLNSSYFRHYALPYRHLYVSRKGILALQETNNICTGKANPVQFEHDELVMTMALACENDGLIKSDWLPDRTLKEIPNLDFARICGVRLKKIPDLVFDLNLQHELKRCAVEVERTRKSRDRYDSLVLSYKQMKNIDLVIIVYNDRYTENSIRYSIKKLGYPQNTRPFAFCRIGDVKQNPSSFQLTVDQNIINFKELVTNMQAMNLDDHKVITNIGRTPDRKTSPENSPVKGS